MPTGIVGDPINVLCSLVLIGFFGGAVGDLVADSDLFSGIREKGERISEFMGDLLSCRFCVSAWGCALGLSLLTLAPSCFVASWVLLLGASWKLSTILRGMNE